MSGLALFELSFVVFWHHFWVFRRHWKHIQNRRVNQKGLSVRQTALLGDEIMTKSSRVCSPLWPWKDFISVLHIVSSPWQPQWDSVWSDAMPFVQERLYVCVCVCTSHSLSFSTHGIFPLIPQWRALSCSSRHCCLKLLRWGKVTDGEADSGETDSEADRERRSWRRWSNRFESCFINTADICLSLWRLNCHTSKGYRTWESTTQITQCKPGQRGLQPQTTQPHASTYYMHALKKKKKCVWTPTGLCPLDRP